METIMYVDDTTDSIKESNTENMKVKIQAEANKITEWMDTNKMVLSEAKAKLMISSTNALRRVHHEEVTVKVKNKTINESKSEKILGIIVSNNLTWKHHFYGETEKSKEERTEGLLMNLSKRVGIFKKVAKYANGRVLRSLAQGIFYSKLCYSLPIIAEVWKKEQYKDKPDSRRSTTREEFRRLQVLQNKVERTVYAKEHNINEEEIQRIPTEELLNTNNMQSIHQIGAQSILNMYRKIIVTEKPNHLYKQLRRTEGRNGTIWKVNNNPKLTISLSNFIEKGTKLWNILDPDVKEIESDLSFKKRCKQWTIKNISIKPG